MRERSSPQTLVRAGDRDGLGSVYSSWGGLIPWPEETILKTADGWDMEVASPWRRFLPKLIFTGFGGDVSSKLYITTSRIVLIRKIDVWREVKGDLTPLGLPNAAAKEVELKRLQAAGAREYCSIVPSELRVSKSKKSSKRRSVLDLRLIGTDSRQYAITIWKPSGLDAETLSLLESRFPR